MFDSVSPMILLVFLCFLYSALLSFRFQVCLCIQRDNYVDLRAIWHNWSHTQKQQEKENYDDVCLTTIHTLYVVVTVVETIVTGMHFLHVTLDFYLTKLNITFKK